MASFAIDLLGGFAVRAPSGEACVLPTRKARALLAYLALPPGRFHSRDKLTALLWGDTAEAQARHSFRQALLTVRRGLGEGEPPVLVTQGDAIALDPAAVTVDVAAFEAALAGGHREGLERAAALYKGDLLDGFGVDEAPFEEWRVVERERLHELALEGLARLLREHVRAEAIDPAIQTALRILALDPLQEAVHRTLMRLLLRQGRRAAALQQYQVCVGWLQRELGAEPEEETRQLYRDLLRTAGSSRSPARPAGFPGEGPMVGRRTEHEALRHALDRTLDDGGRVVLIAGEAGIGKTRLIQEFSAETAARGLPIVEAWCHETEQALPFRPWIDALRGNAAVIDPAIRERISAGSLTTLARLFPELGRPGERPTTTADEHTLLFEALSELVQHLSQEAPLVIVLEDVHWADVMSARLLAFLGRRLGSRPVLIVASMRSEEVVEPPVVHQALSELRTAGTLDEISLEALNREDTLALARELHGTGSGRVSIDRIADELWALSDGNPFVIVEAMRAVKEGASTGRGARPFIPQSVRQAVSDRIARLSEPARRTVATAAVIGRPCSFRLLVKSTGLGEMEAAATVEELVRRRILGTVGDQLGLSHDRVRQVVYEDLVAARRIVVHGAVAQALESLHAESPDEVADQLGHHFLRAGESERALTCLERFAEIAARRYALEAAIEALRQAAVAVETLPEATRDRRRLELAVRRSFVLSLAGRHGEALEILRDQAAVQTRVGDPALASDYYFRLAIHYQWLGRYLDGRQAAEAAAREARVARDDGRQGKALYALSLMSIGVGAIADAVAQAIRATPLLDTPATRHWLALNHWCLTWAYTIAGRLDLGLENADRCLSVAEATGDRRLRAIGGYIKALVHVAYGDSQAALTCAREASEMCADPIATSLALLALGYAHREQGDPRAAIDAFRRVLENRPANVTRTRALAELGDALVLVGDVAAATEAAQEALARGQADDAPFLIGLAHRVLGRIARAMGDAVGSEKHVSQALAAFLSGEAVFEAALTRLDLARALAGRGDPREARRQLTEALRVFDEAGAPRRSAQARQLARSLGLDPAVLDSDLIVS
jgi:DNA-binding SARP family transcriptional activator